MGAVNLVNLVGLVGLLGQGLTVDVEGFTRKMADEKMKSGIARTNQKAAGGKAMVLEAEQVGRLFIDLLL